MQSNTHTDPTTVPSLRMRAEGNATMPDEAITKSAIAIIMLFLCAGLCDGHCSHRCSKKTRKTHAKLTVRFTCQQCIAFNFSIYIIIMLTLSSGAVSEVKHCATYLKQRAETKNLHQSGTCKCRKKSAVNGLFCAMATYFEFRTLGCTLQALVQRNPPQLTNRLTNVSQSCWYIIILTLNTQHGMKVYT